MITFPNITVWKAAIFAGGGKERIRAKNRGITQRLEGSRF